MDPTDNLLLAALPAAERTRLLARSRRVRLDVGEVLYEQDEPIEDAYFPTSGAVSLLISLADGRMLEPAIIGREGLLGFPIGLGDDRSRWQSMVQLPGEAFVVSRADLEWYLRGPGDLAALLMHYAGVMITFTAQSAVCAQFHPLEQRTARWLLIMRDRSADDTIALTQDFLARMLGVHRPSETIALDALRKRGLIELQRGAICVVDRAGLEATACECYERVEREYRELARVAERLTRGEPDIKPWRTPVDPAEMGTDRGVRPR